MAAVLDRDYQSTHPWITFQVDLNRLTSDIWLLLGEASSKCDHLAGVALKPEDARQLWQIYLAKGVHATTSIEGNTMTEEQVRARVDNPQPVPASMQYLANEVDNILKAINEIDRSVMDRSPLSLDVARICALNAKVMAGTVFADDVVPGRLRTNSVAVASYRGAPAAELDYLVGRLCEWLEDLRAEARSHPVIEFSIMVVAAILAHLYLAWIHPFGDGNGRTARLVEFQILASSGVPLPAANLLADHFNRTRSRYYIELDRASRSGGDVVPFLRYAIEGFVDGLREQIGMIREKQLTVAWQNYVHERFQDEPDTPASKRRKRLALCLPHDRWTRRESIPTLDGVMAREYAAPGPRTLARDINALEALTLIQVRGKFVKANRELINAFLAPRAEN